MPTDRHFLSFLPLDLSCTHSFPIANFLLPSKVVVLYPSASLYVSWDVSPSWPSSHSLLRWAHEPSNVQLSLLFEKCFLDPTVLSNNCLSSLFVHLSFQFWLSVYHGAVTIWVWGPVLALMLHISWGNLWFSSKNPSYNIPMNYLLLVFRWSKAMLCVTTEWNSTGDWAEVWHLSPRTRQVSWACMCEKELESRLQAEGSEDEVSDFVRNPERRTAVPGYLWQWKGR